ncbi:hypothetical protein GCM10023080_058780 [Streptomyces pseudoechinosporeus]
MNRGAYREGGFDSWATAGPSWLVAQFPAPLKGASLEPPALMLTSHDVPAASLRREGPWAGASYARRLGSVSGHPHRVPTPGRMPGLRRADAPAHGPDPPPTQGRGDCATSHNGPAADNEPTRPTAGGNPHPPKKPSHPDPRPAERSVPRGKQL